MIAPDIDAAVNFVRRFKCGEPYVQLLKLQKGPPRAVSFRPREVVAMRAWLAEAHAEEAHVYFTPANLDGMWTRKAPKEGVRSSSWLWVEIDSTAPEVVDAFRAFVPRPTVIVFSGGGYWSYWRLREPFVIDGEPAEFERRTRALRDHFKGSDACWNADRIARLPGLVNWKRGNGRVPTLATVVEWGPHEYDIKDFPCAVPVAEQALPELALPDDLPALDEAEVDGINSVIEEYFPRAGYPSRSEWQAAVSRALLQAGLGDAQHVAALMDPRTLVSEAVRVAPSGRPRHDARRYAERQVSRAKGWLACTS